MTNIYADPQDPNMTLCITYSDDFGESKPRRPVGAPRIGMPAMGGGAMMAEMKAKRASMVPLGSKVNLYQSLQV